MKYILFILASIIFFFPYNVSAQSNPELKVANGHREYLTGGAATSDDRLLATAGYDGMIIWDMATGMELKKVSRNHRPDLPFTVPGSSNIGSIHDGVIRIIDGQTLQERTVASITLYFIVKSAVVDQNGRFLYIAATKYDVGYSAVIYKVDLLQNKAQLLHEVTAASLGIPNPDHNTFIEYSNLSLTPDGTKLCARLGAKKESITNNYFVFNTSSFQKEKEWNAEGETMGFITDDLLWHFGFRIIGKDPVPGNKTYLFNLLQYPSLQLKKSTPANFGSIHENKVSNTAQLFDRNGGIFYLATRRGLTSIDINKLTVTTNVVDTANDYTGFNTILLPAGKKLAQSTRAGAVFEIDPLTKIKRSLGGGKPLVPWGFSSNPKRPILSVYSHMYNAIQLIDLSSESVKIYNHNATTGMAPSWSPDGKKAVFYLYVGNKIGVIDADNLAAEPVLISAPEHQGQNDRIQWTSDGKKFAIGPTSGIHVWDATTMKEIRKLPGSERYVGGSFALSKDGSKIVSCVKKPAPAATNAADHWLQCYRVSDGVRLWEMQAPENKMIYEFAFTENDSRIFGCSEKYTYSFDAATGSKQSQNFIGNIAYNSNISPDEKYLFTPQPNALGVIDVQTGTLAYTIKSSTNSGGRSVLLAGHNFVVSTNDDNSLHFYDLTRKLDVGKLFTFANSEEYAFVNNQNYFEGSQQATSTMYFVKDSRILPLQSLFEKFYTPKLVQRVLSRTEPGPPVVNVNTIKAAPTAIISFVPGKRNLTVEDDATPGHSITQPNAVITVQATAPGDLVSEIRLYQNGKLIANHTRNLTVGDDDGLDKKNFDVVLQPGNNDFAAISINSQRTESMPAKLNLTYIVAKATPAQGNGNAPVVAKNTSTTTMHLVVIGINQYKNPRYNLNYAVADAKGFQEKINGACGTLMQQCKPYFISNDQATKDNITKAMQTIANEAAPQDLLVFYYAGHGVMNEAEQKEFFLVPYDVTQLYGNDGGLVAKGISSAELQKLSTAIKAQKQLFILDACQSAGALQQVAMRGAAEEKAIAQLARSTGTHWLTASGSDQFASEFDKLGHGAFTYVLMNGLSGEAAISGGTITVNSLKAYIETKVPEITEQMKGSAQYPASYGYGQDFPIGVKK